LDIENALDVLDDILPKINSGSDCANMSLFTTTVHGMKSVLHNIGEQEQSAVAFRLEQAGHNREIATILADISSFMIALRAILEKNKAKITEVSDDISLADMVFLNEKLSEVKTACQQFKKSVAKAALDELKQKSWSRATNALFDEISVYLLHGEFKKVVSVLGHI